LGYSHLTRIPAHILYEEKNNMKAVVVGASYAGLTAALELRRLLPKGDTVTVISASENFIFFPSLIWVIQGERDPADIAFPIRPVLEETGIEFVPARLDAISPQANSLSLSTHETLTYDKLLIATGGEWNWDAMPGLGESS
jgi:sulfide:quinone oxidoreductase